MIEHIEINGIPTEVPADAVAYKYADPTEDARWIYDADEAREIAAEDPSLILWAMVEDVDGISVDMIRLQHVDEDGAEG